VEDESGEMVWQPAEGGEAISAEQWSHGDEAAEESAPTEEATLVEAATAVPDGPVEDEAATEAVVAADELIEGDTA
jgi:hypothetical protein